MSVRAVNDWENDRKFPSNIPLLEQVLGVQLEDGDDDGNGGSGRAAPADLTPGEIAERMAYLVELADRWMKHDEESRDRAGRQQSEGRKGA